MPSDGDAALGVQARARLGRGAPAAKSTMTATWRVVGSADASTWRTLPTKSLFSKPLMRNWTTWPGPGCRRMRSADTSASKRMLVGSITFTSSLPIAAVSPGDTLRSLTMPSLNGACTPVRVDQPAALATVRESARHAVALRGVAAHLGVVERLLRAHALALQRLDAGVLALGLVERLRRAARLDAFRPISRPSRMDVSSSRTSRSPLVHHLAVLLEHLQHDGRDLRAQVGAALRLDGAGDHGARRVRLQGHRAHVLGRNQQRRCGPRRRPPAPRRRASGSRPATRRPTPAPRR